MHLLFNIVLFRAVCAQVHHVPDDESHDEEDTLPAAVTSTSAREPVDINVTDNKTSETTREQVVITVGDDSTSIVASGSVPDTSNLLSSESDQTSYSSNLNN